MKCTSRIFSAILSFSLLLLLTACSLQKVPDAYDEKTAPADFGLVHTVSADGTTAFFSSGLCVTDATDANTEAVDSGVATAAGVFNLATGQVPYRQNLFSKLYPASTTKIMTALLALKYGKLDNEITVSEAAVQLPAESSVAGLKAGDVLTLRQLLYGLLLVSGNDAANAIAEGVSGDVATFVALMNDEAAALGATGTHFTNANGLPDADHYTTAYDMYLMMNAAVKYPDFVEIIHAGSYEATYRDVAGNPVTKTWGTSNQYLTGYRSMPDGIEVVGGKTGTTGEAGYCLVLFSKNARNEDIISLVFGADARTNLYLLMGEILAGYGNV